MIKKSLQYRPYQPFIFFIKSQIYSCGKQHKQALQILKEGCKIGSNCESVKKEYERMKQKLFDTARKDKGR